MRYRFVFLLGFLLLTSSVFAEQTIVLARAPQLSPTATSQEWSPFIKHLTEATGHNIVLKVYKDRAEFENDIKLGEVDLYFGNPGYGVIGRLKHGYMPLIRSDRKLLEGIVVAKKGSGIETVEQLHGKTIAFPSETAFAASLYIRSRLQADFNIDFEPIYTGSHDNTYRAVLIGKAPAAGGVIRTLEREKPELREQLQIIYTTPGMKSHPLMVHPKLPREVSKAIQKAVLDLDNSEEGKVLLKRVNLQKPVIADYQQDYQPIEKVARKMYRYLLD